MCWLLSAKQLHTTADAGGNADSGGSWTGSPQLLLWFSATYTCADTTACVARLEVKTQTQTAWKQLPEVNISFHTGHFTIWFMRCPLKTSAISNWLKPGAVLEEQDFTLRVPPVGLTRHCTWAAVTLPTFSSALTWYNSNQPETESVQKYS